ncbi:MAG: protease modulator HflC [Alphaproteobacteria bacterium]|nr:protease modulator HflC [Alphaproteobacteria bacterium]OJV14183.1 MAG: hypothetical protein BGO27_01635 [Alphaproteobacteria bacterium 33-17]
MNNSILKITVFLVGLFLLLNSIFVLDQRQQAMVIQFGESVRTVEEAGLHFKVPFIQRVTFFENMILDVSAAEKEVLAKDQKRIIVNAYAKYRIVDVLKYYQSVRSSAQAKSRLISDLESSIRQVVGEEPLTALLTNERAKIMKRIATILNEKSMKAGIKIVDVRISRADLPKENSAAIYSRMQTDREKEAKEFRAQGNEEAALIKSEADKNARNIIADAKKQAEILRGEGDKESNRVIAEMMSGDTEFYSFYKTLESYKNSLSSENTKMVITPDSDYLRYLIKK